MIRLDLDKVSACMKAASSPCAKYPITILRDADGIRVRFGELDTIELLVRDMPLVWFSDTPSIENYMTIRTRTTDRLSVEALSFIHGYVATVAASINTWFVPKMTAELNKPLTTMELYSVLRELDERGSIY